MIPQSVARSRIARKLGAGRIGEVYLAEDPAIVRQVAIGKLSTSRSKRNNGFVELGYALKFCVKDSHRRRRRRPAWKTQAPHQIHEPRVGAHRVEHRIHADL